MTITEYQEKAAQFISPELIDPQLNTNNREMFINASMGLCGETGEVVDLLKKTIFQGHELNADKLIEEAGDVCWYLAELATALNVSMDKFFNVNIEKLSKRYPNGFDKERSIHRKELKIE